MASQKLRTNTEPKARFCWRHFFCTSPQYLVLHLLIRISHLEEFYSCLGLIVRYQEIKVSSIQDFNVKSSILLQSRSKVSNLFYKSRCHLTTAEVAWLQIWGRSADVNDGFLLHWIEWWLFALKTVQFCSRALPLTAHNWCLDVKQITQVKLKKTRKAQQKLKTVKKWVGKRQVKGNLTQGYNPCLKHCP